MSLRGAKRCCPESGWATLETAALLAAITLPLLFALFDFVRIFHSWSALQMMSDRAVQEFAVLESGSNTVSGNTGAREYRLRRYSLQVKNGVHHLVRNSVNTGSFRCQSEYGEICESAAPTAVEDWEFEATLGERDLSPEMVQQVMNELGPRFLSPSTLSLSPCRTNGGEGCLSMVVSRSQSEAGPQITVSSRFNVPLSVLSVFGREHFQLQHRSTKRIEDGENARAALPMYQFGDGESDDDGS